jgi:prephenate dehydrogenase
MKPSFKKVAVIGVGLIGGSLALVFKKKGMAGSITGVGRGQANLDTALRLGIVDCVTRDIREGVEGADLVVVAVPVLKIIDTVKKAAPHLKPPCIVTDVGSVKEAMISVIEEALPEGVSYVPGHPIAGTEDSGAGAAFPELFIDRVCILTPTQSTPAGATDKIKAMWEAAGSRVVTMDAAAHDKVLAAVSHLPHMIAYTLVNTVADAGGGEGPEKGGGKEGGAGRIDEILGYSAGGFRDFTRIASSSPEMWADICGMNREKIVEAIGEFQKRLEVLKKLISTGDSDGVRKEFERAKRIRDSLS